MLLAVLNKSWKQHPTKQQLYGHLALILKTIQVRWTRLMGYGWRSKDELISDILWISIYGHASVGRPAKTYLYQLCVDTGYCLEDLPRVMNDCDLWRESGKSMLSAQFNKSNLKKIYLVVISNGSHFWFLCLMACQPFWVI